jgi:sugar (pentulose or hexulose) kinase
MDTAVTLTAQDASGCFGAAMLAAIGVGEIAGLDETTELVEIAEEYHPSDTGVDYDAKYEAFRKLTGPLETIWGEHYALRS